MKIRISEAISLSIRNSLKSAKHGNHWEAIVGYSLAELMINLENHFEEGMSWSNFGRGDGKWSIDHTRPIASYDFKSFNDSSFQECFSLDNLRPMWWREILSREQIGHIFEPLLD
jgi:hypothetical protein